MSWSSIYTIPAIAIRQSLKKNVEEGLSVCMIETRVKEYDQILLQRDFITCP